MRFRAEVIDADDYNDELVVSAKSVSEARDILIKNYHVKRILEIEEV